MYDRIHTSLDVKYEELVLSLKAIGFPRVTTGKLFPILTASQILGLPIPITLVGLESLITMRKMSAVNNYIKENARLPLKALSALLANLHLVATWPPSYTLPVTLELKPMQQTLWPWQVDILSEKVKIKKFTCKQIFLARTTVGIANIDYRTKILPDLGDYKAFIYILSEVTPVLLLVKIKGKLKVGDKFTINGSSYSIDKIAHCIAGINNMRDFQNVWASGPYDGSNLLTVSILSGAPKINKGMLVGVL